MMNIILLTILYTECVDGQPNYVQTTLLNTHINEGQYIVGAVHSHTVTNRLSNQDLDLAIDQKLFYIICCWGITI